MYWATKVLTYPAIPRKKATTTKLVMPAGSEAASASIEYQVRKTRSRKCCIDQVAVLRMRGKAMARKSR